jgi:exonuclease VII small subunit
MSQTFESAYTRLKEIHQTLSTKELTDIDALLALQQEAKTLYEYLQERLQAITRTDDHAAK